MKRPGMIRDAIGAAALAVALVGVLFIFHGFAG